jgi:hypothetical protein
MPKRFVAVLAVLALWGAGVARAQDDTRTDLWLELDAYVDVAHHGRVMFMAKADESNATGYREGTVGVSADIFAKRLVRGLLQDHPDVSKRRRVAFRAGYRYYWDIDDAPGGSSEHRWMLDGTVRGNLDRWSAGVFKTTSVVNRSRMEWRDVNDESSWRFRNRTRFEGDIQTGSRATTAYLMVEFFYDSRYDEWNRQRYYAGVDWPVHNKAVVDTYYCRQNDSRASVAHENAWGVTLQVYF